MNHKMRWAAMIVSVGLFTASIAAAQLQIKVTNDPSNPDGNGPIVPNAQGNGWEMAPGSFTSNLLRTIKNLNMRPDFTLSIDQKIKIKQARADYDAVAAQWKAAHQGEMTKALNDIMTAMQTQDPLKIQAAQQAMADIGKTAPPISDLDTRVMAILTDDQKKAAQIALEKQAEVDGTGDAPKP